MNTAVGRAAGRELALVVLLAAFGIVLVTLVAFAPWYHPGLAGSDAVVVVVQPFPPVTTEVVAVSAG